MAIGDTTKETQVPQDVQQPAAGEDLSVDPEAASSHILAAGSTASTNSEPTELQTFPLFDLPPELWTLCCQFAVIKSEAVIIEVPDDGEQVEALVAQPPITKTCRAIREETLPLFYQANEFRFMDDGECHLHGLRDWVKALWSSHWALVQKCTIASCHGDIVDHMQSELEGFAEVEFDGEAPDDGEDKVLKFMAKAIQYSESDAGDGEEGRE